VFLVFLNKKMVPIFLLFIEIKAKKLNKKMIITS